MMQSVQVRTNACWRHKVILMSFNEWFYSRTNRQRRFVQKSPYATAQSHQMKTTGDYQSLEAPPQEHFRPHCLHCERLHGHDSSFNLASATVQPCFAAGRLFLFPNLKRSLKCHRFEDVSVSHNGLPQAYGRRHGSWLPGSLKSVGIAMADVYQ